MGIPDGVGPLTVGDIYRYDKPKQGNFPPRSPHRREFTSRVRLGEEAHGGCVRGAEVTFISENMTQTRSPAPLSKKKRNTTVESGDLRTGCRAQLNPLKIPYRGVDRGSDS